MIDRQSPGTSISERGWRAAGAFVGLAIFSLAPWWMSWRIICSSILVWVGYALSTIAWRFISTRSERHIIKEKRGVFDAALLNSKRAHENPNSSDRKSATDALLLATEAYSTACAPSQERLNRVMHRRAHRLEIRVNFVGLLMFALAVVPFTFLPWEQHAIWAVAILAVWLATALVALIRLRLIRTA